MAQGASPSTADSRGTTAVHWASFGGHIDCLLTLLSVGGPAHAVNLDGETPLMWAAVMGHADVADALLAYMVRPGELDAKEGRAGETALM